MSYFPGLKLTKQGERLLAKVNGNLSETITFKRAELGAGTIASNDEIRFLRNLKQKWKDVNVSDCKIVGDDQTQVLIELQFNNKDVGSNKLLREIGIYAAGNDDNEVLFAYSNAGDNYDFIPPAKDNPQSFIINVLVTITSNTKVDATIDLNSYVSLRVFKEELAKKANVTHYHDERYYTESEVDNKLKEIETKLSKSISNTITVSEIRENWR